MSKDRKRDRKRKKKLAEKKRKAHLAESLVYMGSKYQTEELIPTWMHTEVGIYETYVMTDRKLLDQTVFSSIETLIRQLRAGTLPPLPDTGEIHYEVGREEDFEAMAHVEDVIHLAPIRARTLLDDRARGEKCIRHLSRHRSRE